jgi:hypothetical protein
MNRRIYRSLLLFTPAVGLSALGCFGPGGPPGFPSQDGPAAIAPRAAKVYRTEWIVKAANPVKAVADKTAVATTAQPAAPPIVQASAIADKPAIVQAAAIVPPVVSEERTPTLPPPPALSLTIPPRPLPAPPMLPLAIPPAPAPNIQASGATSAASER